MVRRTWVTAVLVALLASCGKKEPPAPSPSASSKLPKVETLSERIARINRNPKLPEYKKAFLRAEAPLDVAKDLVAVEDRAELVLPPPPGWKPESAERKLKLTFTAEKAIIRKGEKFRFRLELQNTGRKKLFLYEFCPSFMKSGIVSGGIQLVRLYAKPPGAEEVQLWGPSSTGDFRTVELHFPDGWTDERKMAELERRKLASQAECQLQMHLEPGEALVTKPDLPSPNRFLELRSDLEFDKPGTYRIKAVYDDVGDHPDVEREKSLQRRMKGLGASREELLRFEERRRKEGISLEQVRKQHEARIALHEKNKLTAVGRTESNEVALEVVP